MSIRSEAVCAVADLLVLLCDFGDSNEELTSALSDASFSGFLTCVRVFGELGAESARPWGLSFFARLARFRARFRAASPRHSSSQYRADAFFPDGNGSPHAAHFMLAV